MDQALDPEGAGYGVMGPLSVRPQVDYCSVARDALIKAGGDFSSATCDYIQATICSSTTLFRDGSSTSNAILQWAGCAPSGPGGTPPPTGSGSVSSIKATFEKNPPTAHVTFAYSGSGLVAVNWWVVRPGTAPAVLGGISANEVAYKQVTLSPSGPGTYSVDLVIPAGYIPGDLGSYDSYIAIYQGTGTTAQLLGFASYPGSTGGGQISSTVVLAIVGVAALAGIATFIASRKGAPAGPEPAPRRILIARIPG